jgi:glyoxylase-like metal-dependent hydrolase (beta-lactamase superfamily II)
VSSAAGDAAGSRSTGGEPRTVLEAARLGAWATNCIILGDRSTGQAVVVDPGQHGAQAVPVLLERVGLRAAAILLTHAHLDHLWAAPELARALDVPVHLHPDDTWLWDRPEQAFGAQGAQLVAGFGFTDWDVDGVELRPLADGQRLELAGITFDVHHTPGHTPGHVVFVTEDLVGAPVRLDERALAATGSVLLSGDLLFAGSIGRTDLAGGDPAAMSRSLAACMARCTDATLVIPGHGNATTIGEERASNPFLSA